MTRPTREQFHVFQPITLRWADNDAYGHVNNVVYYAWFDTCVNQYMISNGCLDIQNSDVIGYVVKSNCDYFEGVAYPDTIETGLRVNRLGSSSVEYGIGIFKAGQDEAIAYGGFTHVFVDRATEKSTPIPEPTRALFEKILAQ